MLTERFDRAVARAREWHGAQRRKASRVPYVAHLFSVVALVLEAGGDEDQAVAALLHDALEDAPDRAASERRAEAIGEEFGERVLAIVRGCTDGDPEERRALAWHVRKERYVAGLGECAEEALLVSAADKLHNARQLLYDYGRFGEVLWGPFNAPAEEILWYHRELADAFAARLAADTPAGRLAAELVRVVAELESLVAARAG